MNNEDKKPRVEKRKNSRIKKSFVLSYFLLSRPNEKYELTQLKNISQGGMCFVTTRKFEPSVKVGIHLKTPYLSGTTYLEGITMESHEKIKDLIYETRIQFTHLDQQAELMLNKLIEFFVNGKGAGHE